MHDTMDKKTGQTLEREDTVNEQQKQQQQLVKPNTKEHVKRLKQLNNDTTYEPPNLKKARKRLKKDVDIHYDFTIPEDMRRIGENQTYYIRTYGCQMNEHDTEVMSGLLLEMGYTEAHEMREADVILLNTCAIRENAENKVFGELGHSKPIKKENPDVIIGICGCMSQEEGVVNRIMQKHPFVDMIFGTHNIHRLPSLLKEAMFQKAMVVEVWSKEGDIIENLPKQRKGKLKAWVNIMYGCD